MKKLSAARVDLVLQEEKGKNMNDIIEKFLKERFVSDIGFAKCEDTPFEGLENAVSLVFRLSDAVVDGITDSPTHTYFHHYRTMNTYIDSVSLQLVMMLQEKGYMAAAIPASQSIEGLQALYSHKKAAIRAGLGSIGKSALFISEKYGPRVRLGTVFTNAPVMAVCEKQKDICKNCDICARACKAMAIKNISYCENMAREDFFDAKACSDYMKDKFKNIGRGAVCGVCMRVCPKGR